MLTFFKNFFKIQKTRKEVSPMILLEGKEWLEVTFNDNLCLMTEDGYKKLIQDLSRAVIEGSIKNFTVIRRAQDAIIINAEE